MSCDIEAAPAQMRVYRVGRPPPAWEWPNWSKARPDGTCGGRYDDPRGEHRVPTGARSASGAFVEALSPYRAAAVVAGRREIATVDARAGLEPGGSRAWVGARAIGERELARPTWKQGRRCGSRFLGKWPFGQLIPAMPPSSVA